MNIALIDDSLEDMNFLSSHIDCFFANRRLSMPICINSFQNEQHFLEQYRKHQYDIIFIDYFLNRLTGMELAKNIRILDAMAVMIFTTVSKDYAIDSYRVKASGYLVKPIEYQDFEEMMQLIDCKKLRDNQFIELSNGLADVKILLKDIVYCDISGHYTHIHTSGNEVIKCRQPFSVFTDRLTLYPEFLSCYRGCIINMKKVKKLNASSFLMVNGEQIPFRTKQKAEIISRYTEFLFEQNRKGEF